MATATAYNDFIATLSARRADREKGAQEMKKHPEWEATMVATALNPKAGRKQQISAWILELYFLEQLPTLGQYLPKILDAIPEITNESVRRPLSKLLYYYITASNTHLETKTIDRIVAIAFDWLIAPAQVATLNFALRILNHYRNHKPWIKEELIHIVKQQLPNASAGYHAAAREILKEY